MHKARSWLCQRLALFVTMNVAATNMTFHRTLIISLVCVLYYGLAWYGLYAFGAGILLTSLILFGVPAYALARFSSAPSQVLVSVSVFGASLAFLMESIAHTYGLWYTIGEDVARVLGVVPIEAVVATTLQVLFLALLYEAMFDDGVYTDGSSRNRFAAFGVLAGTIAFLVIFEAYFDTRLIENPYQWLISAFVLACFLSLLTYRSLTIRFLDRLIYFTLAATVPLSINLMLAVTNVHRVFANVHEYAYSYVLFSSTIPLEEFLLALTVPLLVGTVYEIYLDDIA